MKKPVKTLSNKPKVGSEIVTKKRHDAYRGAIASATSHFMACARLP